MTTTTITIPEPKYRRLDMAKLPPYRLEKISEIELKAAIPFYNVFSPICFKNIWNDEKEAKRAEDEKKADLARTVTSRTQTKPTKMRRPFCKFCQQHGLPLKDCKTHYTKSGPEFGSKITCPVLLQQQCSRCGEIGHTPKYCKSEHWLKTDPREISSYRSPLSINWFPPSFLTDSYIPQWQKPIPPALQKRHEEYEEKYVKTSRIWIEMTGDHKHYTNDFRLVMLIEDEDSWFEKKPRTEYEEMVQNHWELMRKVIWDDTPVRDRSNFYIIRSMPPTYEEAYGAVKFIESVEAMKTATIATTKNEREFDIAVWECERTMRKIIGKYIEHQRL
jgi:RNase P subunit RPR2